VRLYAVGELRRGQQMPRITWGVVNGARSKDKPERYSDIMKHSLDVLRELREHGETETRPDAPARKLGAEFWEGARVVMPPGTSSIRLRVDADVLEWFRGQGRGHLARMNAVPRSFMDAQKRASA
jgi:uncharacterized protein (DUF4415 family)